MILNGRQVKLKGHKGWLLLSTYRLTALVAFPGCPTPAAGLRDPRTTGRMGKRRKKMTHKVRT